MAEQVDLAAAVQLLPDSGQYPNPKAYPDLTGGFGTAVYDFGQALGDQIARAIVNGISLTALAQAAGVDPQSLVNTLLADIPANLVPDIVAAIGLELPILDTVLGQLTGGDAALLSQVLNLLGLDEATDGTITGLLALLGLDLADPLNLSNLITGDLGVNLITAGPTFSVLKMLGLDLGWVPAFPNSVANEINNSEYLKIGVNGLLNTVIDQLQEAIDGGTLESLNLNLLGDILDGLGVILPLPLPDLPLPDLEDVVGDLIGELGNILDDVTEGLPDVLHTRITPTVGIGLGAFAASMAYQQVIDDLENQPGGTNYEQLTGELNPLLGSLSILPMILINNPARPDGGMFARFGPLAALFGIDTVNPRTELTGEGGLPVLNTGLHLGGANVLPILVDATYEYQPLSDFAAWPNPVTLANNLAAALLPTYMLRGLTLDGLTGQLTPQLTAALANVAAGNPLALNIYLTLNSATLPLLEPLYLASDALNLVGLSPLAQIPMRIANALAPALGIMTDLGYGNVTRNPDGTYTRDFSTAGQEVPFLSFPNVDPFQAFGDVVNALFAGIAKELGPNPTPGTPNALKTLLDAVLGGGLGGLFGGLNLAPQGIASVPEPNARLMSLSEDVTGSDQNADAAPLSETDGKEDADGDATGDPQSETDADQGQPTVEQPAEQPPVEQPAVEQPAAEELPEETPDAEPPAAEEQEPEQEPEAEVQAGPKHAKEEAEGDAPVTASGNAPKHARPELNVVRDSANFSPDAQPKTEGAEGGGDGAAAVTATPAEQPSAPAGETAAEGDKEKGSEAA